MRERVLEEPNKVALVSGKLSGTKTLDNCLESIEKPDEVEKFLTDFIHWKVEINMDNEVIYVNEDSSFLEYLETIEKSASISLLLNENYTTLSLTTEEKKTYIIRLNKVSSAVIARLLIKEKPVKFLFHSFHFMKWCISQKIEMKNGCDIPTYIKILTNEIDPFQSLESYIEKYTNCHLEKENSKANTVIIGNFILEFGKYLEERVKEFGLEQVCKAINENSYYEANLGEERDNCIIRFEYSNIKQVVDAVATEKKEEYAEKAYLISPLGRIALKFGHQDKELMEELYAEDISITILNELYNNNIRVIQDEEGNYLINCKYKNIGNVFSFIVAILDDVFYRMFEQTFEASIHCEIKE